MKIWEERIFHRNIIKEIFELSQLEENKPIYIVMNKKEGASCITTHLLLRSKQTSIQHHHEIHSFQIRSSDG
ncbi:hypothetical protein C5Z04_22070 [Phocaeicola vulgatus]|nr:hypothetical protein C5Z04_22070 [Phocaeicola vulgatus]